MDPSLLRRAGQQSLTKMLLFYGLAIGLGLWTQHLAEALLAATTLLAGWAYWRLYRVLHFLQWRKQLRATQGHGLWNALEILLHRRQTENRIRARRLIRLVRTYRQAATAMPDDALVISRNELIRLEQVRRDFVANVSHELRTPLTVIHGYLDMIDPDESPEWAPIVQEMRKQSQRMTQLVEDLLTLSRLEAQEHLPEETIAMTPLLLTLQREAEALSQGRHILCVEDNAQCDLFGSAKELYSAFSNLVSNAIRYTPTDGRVTIRFSRTAEGEAVLAVQDSGYGIPAQHIPRITERFYRVSTSRSRESGGTGLGLSIVKHVLNLHQGRLEITSEVGRGSTFACVFGSERVRLRTN